MRCLRSMCQGACVVLLSFTAEAQGLVSYGAAAAAGGTAGTVGGAKLNKAIDEVLGKAGNTAQRAAKQTSPEPARKQRPLEKSQSGEIIHVSVVPDASVRASSAVPPASRSTKPAPVEPPPADAPAAVIPSSLPNALATPEALASVQSGAQRGDLARLGEPAYKMIIPEDGHMVEVYRYRAGGKDVGTVRLTDGVVTSVQNAPE